MTDVLDLPDHIDYEQRVLLYCDILGWKKFVVNKQHESRWRDKIPELLHDVWRLSAQAQDIERRGRQIDFDIRVGHFSDTMVFSTASSPEAHSLLIGHAAHLANKFLAEGFLCRGAIVVGALFHRNDKIFGPALVRAYEMESEIAKRPRILVAEDLARDVQSGDMLVRDTDGCYSVEVFQLVWQQTNGNVTWNKANLTPISAHISRKLAEHRGNPPVHSKWQYAARQFNRFVALHPELNLAQLQEV